MLTKTKMNKLTKIFLTEDKGKRQITAAKMRRILKAMIIADAKWQIENDSPYTSERSLFEFMIEASDSQRKKLERKK